VNHGTKMSGAACDLLIGLNARTLQCAEPLESPRSLIMQVLSSSAGGIDGFSRTTRSFQDSPPYVLFSCPLLFALTEVSSGPGPTLLAKPDGTENLSYGPIRSISRRRSSTRPDLLWDCFMVYDNQTCHTCVLLRLKRAVMRGIGFGYLRQV
jgi:hypothetical protein